MSAPVSPRDRGCGPDGPTDQGYEARLLRPAQPRLGEAETVALEAMEDLPARDPAALDAAREALAERGLLAADWLDPARLPVAGPYGVDDLVRLAADPEGVATAEAFGREAARRAAPWLREPPTGRVLWSFDAAFPAREVLFVRFPPAGRLVAELSGGRVYAEDWARALFAAADEAPDPARRTRMLYLATAVSTVLVAPPQGWSGHAWEALAAWRAWELFVTEPTERSRWPAYELGARVAGRPRLRDLPNPFAPLVDIWCIGYGVKSVDPEGVVLYAGPPGKVAWTRPSRRQGAARTRRR